LEGGEGGGGPQVEEGKGGRREGGDRQSVERKERKRKRGRKRKERKHAKEVELDFPLTFELQQ